MQDKDIWITKISSKKAYLILIHRKRTIRHKKNNVIQRFRRRQTIVCLISHWQTRTKSNSKILRTLISTSNAQLSVEIGCWKSGYLANNARISCLSTWHCARVLTCFFSWKKSVAKQEKEEWEAGSAEKNVINNAWVILSRVFFSGHSKNSLTASHLCTANLLPKPSSQQPDGIGCWDFRVWWQMMRTCWG